MIRRMMIRSCTRTQCSPALVLVALVAVLLIAFISYHAVVLATALWTLVALAAVGLGFAGRAVFREARKQAAENAASSVLPAGMPDAEPDPVQEPKVLQPQTAPSTDAEDMQRQADELASPATALSVAPDGTIIQI